MTNEMSTRRARPKPRTAEYWMTDSLLFVDEGLTLSELADFLLDQLDSHLYRVLVRDDRDLVGW
jgi:hypothetical protein